MKVYQKRRNNMSLPAVLQIQLEDLIEQFIEEGMTRKDAEKAAIDTMVEREYISNDDW
tara:strand:+ start:650 stop:823 length:174 start_codon:yes stop_codon:yes gene_type:complete